MITDKLTIFGDREDVTNICDLLEKCAQSLGVELADTVLYAQEILECAHYSQDVCVILPYALKDKISGGKMLTYSEKESAADVTLLNLQKREANMCFEVLSGASMSRVFVPYGSGYTSEQVLACVSVLCAWGASVSGAVSKINSILK